jgi:hypothetical protein
MKLPTGATHDEENEREPKNNKIKKKKRKIIENH